MKYKFHCKGIVQVHLTWDLARKIQDFYPRPSDTVFFPTSSFQTVIFPDTLLEASTLRDLALQRSLKPLLESLLSICIQKGRCAMASPTALSYHDHLCYDFSESIGAEVSRDQLLLKASLFVFHLTFVRGTIWYVSHSTSVDMINPPNWSPEPEPRPQSRQRPKSESAMTDQPIYENLKLSKPAAQVFVEISTRQDSMVPDSGLGF